MGSISFSRSAESYANLDLVPCCQPSCGIQYWASSEVRNEYSDVYFLLSPKTLRFIQEDNKNIIKLTVCVFYNVGAISTSNSHKSQRHQSWTIAHSLQGIVSSRSYSKIKYGTRLSFISNICKMIGSISLRRTNLRSPTHAYYLTVCRCGGH
jgi:hypothetical protein